MSTYTDYANGKITLTSHLVAKGYGQPGGVCNHCHKPPKRFPVYNDGLCMVCFNRNMGKRVK